MPTPSIEVETLRESQDRALHLEGIPMFVGLSDERGAAALPLAPEPAGTRAAAILSRMEHYRTALAPSQRESDMGMVISVLTVSAYEDFDRSVSK